MNTEAQRDLDEFAAFYDLDEPLRAAALPITLQNLMEGRDWPFSLKDESYLVTLGQLRLALLCLKRPCPAAKKASAA